MGQYLLAFRAVSRLFLPWRSSHLPLSLQLLVAFSFWLNVSHWQVLCMVLIFLSLLPHVYFLMILSWSFIPSFWTPSLRIIINWIQIEESGQCWFQWFFSPLFSYYIYCKIWAKSTHVLWERKEGFWFNVGGLCTAASAFFDVELRSACPGASGRARALPQNGMVLCIWSSWLWQTKGLVSQLSAMGKNHDRLTDHEFLSTPKESTDGTKPVACVTVFMGSSSCLTIKDTIF